MGYQVWEDESIWSLTAEKDFARLREGDEVWMEDGRKEGIPSQWVVVIPEITSISFHIRFKNLVGGYTGEFHCLHENRIHGTSCILSKARRRK